MSSELIAHLPPAFILILGGFLLPFFKENARRTLVVLLPVLALLQSWMLPTDAADFVYRIAGFEVKLLYIHDYSKLFATIFCLMAFTGSIYALNKASLTESCASFIYAGSALGVVFSGDLLSFFIFWELMAIASSIVIFCSGTCDSRAAGLRYGYMHFVGGAILLCGITSYITLSGSAELAPIVSQMDWMLTLTPDAYVISLWLMMIGVLINAAVPPLSAWLPDSYPEASTTGTIFLSTYTTKTAVFALLILFAGNDLLLYIGAFTMVYGLLYALLENNVRRSLSYGLISQIGVMIIGIGIGSDAALAAVVLVAFGHILYKGLWFMVAGAVIEATERRNLNELGMLWHHMKPTAIIAGIASLAMAAPLTTGFIGKTLLGEAATEAKLHTFYLCLTAGAASMFLVLARLYWNIFFGSTPASAARIKPTSNTMLIAMSLMAIACTIPAFPHLYSWLLSHVLPKDITLPTLYSIKHVIAQSELILFSALAFLTLNPFLKNTTSTLLDFDWLYRVLIKRVLKAILGRIHYHYWPTALSHTWLALSRIIKSAYVVHGPKGVFSRSWNISTTVLWSVALLGIYMALYYSS